MGLLHRIFLNDAPTQLKKLFPFAMPRSADVSSTRRYSPWLLRRHNTQLKEQTIGTDILRRSLFGLVYISNLVPQAIIDLKSIRLFQSAVQRALCLAASQRLPIWVYLLSTRLRPVRDIDFQRYFAM